MHSSQLSRHLSQTVSHHGEAALDTLRLIIFRDQNRHESLYSWNRSQLHQQGNHEEHLEVPGLVEGVERGEVVQSQWEMFVSQSPVGERDGGVEDDGRQPQSVRHPGPGHG